MSTQSTSSKVCPVCKNKKPVLLETGVEDIRICYGCQQLLPLAYGNQWRKLLQSVIKTADRAEEQKQARLKARRDAKRKVVN